MGMMPYSGDIAAETMLPLKYDVKRRDELVKLLGIDLAWRMHQVSDGQRKKVQVMLQCVLPFKFCIVDEFINEIDVVVRNRLYHYLDKEIAERNGCMIYASHIFDNLETHFNTVLYINNGRLHPKMSMEQFMIKYNSETLRENQKVSLFMAVYYKLKEDEDAGLIGIEGPQGDAVFDPLTDDGFKGSGYGGGRAVFMRDDLSKREDVPKVTTS